jgi:hypothetical protein
MSPLLLGVRPYEQSLPCGDIPTSGMNGVHFLEEFIAEYRANIFPRCVYTIRREVRCGTLMLSLGQALEGAVFWLP